MISVQRDVCVVTPWASQLQTTRTSTTSFEAVIWGSGCQLWQLTHGATFCKSPNCLEFQFPLRLNEVGTPSSGAPARVGQGPSPGLWQVTGSKEQVQPSAYRAQAGFSCECCLVDRSCDFENPSPEYGVPGTRQDHLLAWSPIPPSLARGFCRYQGARAVPHGTPSPCGRAACHLSACLVLAVRNRTFSPKENIIVCLATSLILQSQYLGR